MALKKYSLKILSYKALYKMRLLPLVKKKEKQRLRLLVHRLMLIRQKWLGRLQIHWIRVLLCKLGIWKLWKKSVQVKELKLCFIQSLFRGRLWEGSLIEKQNNANKVIWIKIKNNFKLINNAYLKNYIILFSILNFLILHWQY